MDTFWIILLCVFGLINVLEVIFVWTVYILIRNKQYKFYEIVKCECGHDCPIEFAVINDDSNYTCPDCYIEYLTERIKDMPCT